MCSCAIWQFVLNIAWGSANVSRCHHTFKCHRFPRIHHSEHQASRSRPWSICSLYICSVHRAARRHRSKIFGNGPGTEGTWSIEVITRCQWTWWCTLWGHDQTILCESSMELTYLIRFPMTSAFKIFRTTSKSNCRHYWWTLRAWSRGLYCTTYLLFVSFWVDKGPMMSCSVIWSPTWTIAIGYCAMLSSRV